MSGLRRIKPLPLAGLSPAVVGSDLPELIWVAPTDLLVDATYQRDLSDRSMRLIRKTVEQFAWNRMKPPVVVRVGDELHVIDGQHTAIGTATLAIPKIPIFVVSAANLDERARAFVGHNTDRVTVSPLDIYQALLASGDPDAQDVANVCRRAGVRIRNISQSSAVVEGDTAAIGVVRALVKRRGVRNARRVLECLVKAKRTPILAAEILAADVVVCVDRKDVDLDILAAVIRIEGDEGLAKAHAKAKADRTPIWKEVAARWRRRLDRSAS